MTNKAVILAIGTELTRGIIRDQHGPLLSKELTRRGIHITEIIALPDDDKIESVLKAVIKNNDIVLITGGLGPTSDDMTRYAIANVCGKEVKINEDMLVRLKQRVQDRAMGANLKQAMIPEGFSPLLNPNGTAEGFYGYKESTLIVSMPGPPREMNPMFYNYVLDLLKPYSIENAEDRDEYEIYLLGESKLEELTQEINPKLTWATRYQDQFTSLFISGGNQEERKKAIKDLERLIGKERILREDEDYLSNLINLLLEKNITISAAESCTGGGASYTLTERAGSSLYFLGSIVSYANSAKENLLEVPKEIIDENGAVSKECAKKMAEGALKKFNSDFAFSITGVAGPGASDKKEEGLVCFGFAGKQRKSETVVLKFTSWGRSSVRKRSIIASLILLTEFINSHSLIDIEAKWSYI